jgi:hypothetical protein
VKLLRRECIEKLVEKRIKKLVEKLAEKESLFRISFYAIAASAFAGIHSGRNPDVISVHLFGVVLRNFTLQFFASLL